MSSSMKDLTTGVMDDDNDDNNRHHNSNNSSNNNTDDDGGGWDTVQRKKGSGGDSSNRKKNRQQQQQQQQYYYQIEGIGPTVLQPPTSIDDIDCYYKPFIILLVGLPGSGKSTLAKTLTKLMPWKFIRINQDTLGSRQKCERALIQVLKDNNKNIIRLQNNNKSSSKTNDDESASATTSTSLSLSNNSQQQSQQSQQSLSLIKLPLCPIIDRCNFDYQQRLTWYNIAHQYGDDIPVHVIVLDGVTTEECIQRCQHRTKHETVHPSSAKAVVTTVAQQFQRPTSTEQQKRRSRSRSSQPPNEEVVSSSRRRDRYPATSTSATTRNNRKTDNSIGYTTMQRWRTVDDYNDGLIRLLNQKQ